MTNARRSRRLLRFAAAGLTGAAALLVPLAGPAAAGFQPREARPIVVLVRPGVATYGNGVLTIDTATNSASDLRVVDWPAPGLDMVLVGDHDAPLKAGNGCIAVPGSSHFMACPTPTHLVVRAGNLDDQITATGSWATSDVDGGSGHDTITTGASSDRINGGTGRDTIDAGPGSDVLVGGQDADVDHLDGGTGIDDCHAGTVYVGCENQVDFSGLPR